MKKIKKLFVFFLAGLIGAPLFLALVLSYIKINAILYLSLLSLTFLGVILLGIAICGLVFWKKTKVVFVGKTEKHRFLWRGIFFAIGAGIITLAGWVIYGFYSDEFGFKQKILETKITEPRMGTNQWDISCHYTTTIFGDYYDFLCGDKNAQIENWSPDVVYRLTLLENSRYIIKTEKIK